MPWLETPFSSEKDTGHQEAGIKSWPQAILVLTLGKSFHFHEPVYLFYCSEKLIFQKRKVLCVFKSYYNRNMPVMC